MGRRGKSASQTTRKRSVYVFGPAVKPGDIPSSKACGHARRNATCPVRMPIDHTRPQFALFFNSEFLRLGPAAFGRADLDADRSPPRPRLKVGCT